MVNVEFVEMLYEENEVSYVVGTHLAAIRDAFLYLNLEKYF